MRRMLLIAVILFLSILSACQSTKIQDSDIVFEQTGEITNRDELETFIRNVKDGKKDQVRIVRRTIEGAPIFDALDYNGEEIMYTNDDSQDAFGGPDKGVQVDTCTDLESRETGEGMEYYLTGCSTEIGEYFSFEIQD